MTSTLSPNTQAILLLTAPLIAGRGASTPDLLTPSEYKRLARHLLELKKQPADFISPDAREILQACKPIFDINRLQRLLERGFLLSQVVERWHTRAIWVFSRADAEYPRRLKARLREDAPTVLYGCGETGLLKTGGLAVVGPRHADDALIDYTMSVGQLTACAGKTLFSGGARGIDQAAMRGALMAGGKVCGILAENLDKTVMNREHRNLLLDGQLVLVSPYDPSARFNVGNAMQRNKLIYALSDAALVVNSDVEKGGTRSGAVEQLDKFKFVPVYVRSTGAPSAGLDALRIRGALNWPNPQDVDSFKAIFGEQPSKSTAALQPVLELSEENYQPIKDEFPAPMEAKLDFITQPANNPVLVDTDTHEEILKTPYEESIPVKSPESVLQVVEEPPAERLFSVVRKLVQQLVTSHFIMKENKLADELGISKSQTKAWLERLVDEGILEKQKNPLGYIVKQKQQQLFDP